MTVYRIIMAGEGKGRLEDLMLGRQTGLLTTVSGSVVEPEPDFLAVKKLRLRAVAVWLRGTGVAK